MSATCESDSELSLTLTLAHFCHPRTRGPSGRRGCVVRSRTTCTQTKLAWMRGADAEGLLAARIEARASRRLLPPQVAAEAGIGDHQ